MVRPTSTPPAETPTPEAGVLPVDEQCAQELSGPPGPAGDGLLLLQDPHESLIFLLDLKSGKLTQLPKDYYHMLGLSVSPDREWFAYTTSTSTDSGDELQIILSGAECGK